ncbi:MAG TPA: SPOR domain-containing protein [Flavobacteriaceae bacterium]|nr:SPOR domain-containing protein [Flavobacteriaceae bacterium]
MTLAKYISELLYRYECVIVPTFGAFVTNTVSAQVNHFTHTFYPPSKKITFNSNIKNNDGLLVNYIANSEQISYDKAFSYIKKELATWNALIAEEGLELAQIGSFNINENNQLIFEPNTTTNYLTSSFGLDSYVSPAVKRITSTSSANTSKKVALPVSSTKKKSVPVFLKYAASAAIVFALGTFGWNQYQQQQYNKLLAEAEMQQQKVEKSIQEATFVISNPLPTITLNVTKQTYNYHIIAGAFREPVNAEKKLNQLQQKGYNARILGVNKWNLTQVAYQSFNNKREALNSLRTIKKNEGAEAWLLVKQY